MKAYTVVFLLAAVVFVECGHTFMGTNVFRPLVYHKEVRYGYKIFQKRIEYLNFTLPAVAGYPRSIQGFSGFKLWQEKIQLGVASGGHSPTVTVRFTDNIVCAMLDLDGILAYDMTRSDSPASANVTRGGIGYNFVNLRMKSDRSKELHYDVYIYA